VRSAQCLVLSARGKEGRFNCQDAEVGKGEWERPAGRGCWRRGWLLWGMRMGKSAHECIGFLIHYWRPAPPCLSSGNNYHNRLSLKGKGIIIALDFFGSDRRFGLILWERNGPASMRRN
jgi:hypothetical protein